MVRGLDLFREHFEGFGDRYALIGGTACTIAMKQEGLDFRATKDLDMVLIVEALDADFVSAFWDFVHEGGYKHRQKSTGKPVYYRFHEPKEDSYPIMIELFSRVPDSMNLGEDSHLTPIPVEEPFSSLSAILLNDDYYNFIRTGRREVDGLPLVGPEYLIPLKARAWLDLVKRKRVGELVDDKDIRKHRNDIIRLYPILSPRVSLEIPNSITKDMLVFLDEILKDGSINVRSLGIRNATIEQIVSDLKSIYKVV